jgi:hypothetical protein
MDERFQRGFDIRMVRLQPWKVWALAVVGGAVILAVIVALAGMALILVPVLLVSGLVAKLVLGTSARRPKPTAGSPDVIEGRYEVVEVRRDSHVP